MKENKITEMFEGENSSLRKTYDEANKTEQIRDLRKEFITWYKLKVADFEWIGEEEITDWWLSKLSEQQLSILEQVEKLKKDHTVSAAQTIKEVISIIKCK